MFTETLTQRVYLHTSKSKTKNKKQTHIHVKDLFEIAILEGHVFISFIHLANVFKVSRKLRSLCWHGLYGDE